MCIKERNPGARVKLQEVKMNRMEDVLRVNSPEQKRGEKAGKGFRCFV